MGSSGEGIPYDCPGRRSSHPLIGPKSEREPKLGKLSGFHQILAIWGQLLLVVTV